MKIEQATTLAALNRLVPEELEKRTIPARSVAHKVIRAAAMSGNPKEESSDKWANKWLSSHNFVLIEIEAGRIACPTSIDKHMVQRLMGCSVDAIPPLVVDVNKNKIGTTGSGYTPKVIICDGGDRQRALMAQGRVRIKAWVGKKAIRHLFGSIDNINAGTEFSSSELNSRLQQLLQDKFPTPKGQFSSIYVRDLYPLESYCIYSNDGKMWKQFFKVTSYGEKREIELDGEPTEVREAYVDAGANRKTSKLEACAMLNGYIRDPHDAGRVNPTFGGKNSAINLGIKAKKDDRNGNKTKLDRLLVKFRAAVKNGWVPPIQGKSPKGWEDTVEKMKEDAPGIDNPFALAYWMKDQGYSPHHPPGSEDKKKK